MSTESAAVTVLALTRAVATGDAELFAKATEAVEEPERQLLLVWLHEAITGRFSVFTAADVAGFDSAQLTRMLRGLTRFSQARPRLAVRAGLARLIPAP